MMPGFTGEASLYRRTTIHRTSTVPYIDANVRTIAPQRMPDAWDCYDICRKYGGGKWECYQACFIKAY
jgi:hypothetical protein